MDTYGLSPTEYDELSEKGRRLACAMIAQNPEAKARVEMVYGLDYCRRRYPEAYQTQPETQSLWDKLKRWLRW